jgi:ABC-type branched-subunit amino acid transport system ATPase component/branched-subunit amino acid ABC-type transport system permease component
VLPFIIVGLVTGSVYGLAGVGLVLTYKTSGIFNFAYGALATVAAYFFYALYVQHHWPLWAALVVAVPVLAVVEGVGFEKFAERVSRAKLAVQIAATVGIFLIVEALAVIFFGPNSRTFPQYLYHNESMKLAGVHVQASQIFVFTLSVLITAGLWVFLRQARIGVAMRAVVDDAELMNLAGTSPARVRRAAWIIGCFFAALSGLLLAPSVDLDPSTLTLLVVDAYAAAALGGFSSLPLTWLGGIVLGVAAALATKYVNSTSLLGALPATMPFIILFLVILVYPKRRLFTAAAPLARRTASSWSAPWRFQAAGGLLVVAFLCCVPIFSGFRTDGWTTALTDMILLLSLGLLVRTSGHVSLCQASFAAIGAVAFSKLAVNEGLPWLLALLLAGLIVVPIGALLAIPAIRLGGLFLALATFGFGLWLADMFYQSSVMFGVSNIGITDPRPGVSWLSSDKGFYYLVLGLTILLSLLVVAIVHSRLGRLLRGISDSPIALTANGAAVNMTHVLVFCISSFLAGISGALLGATIGSINGLSFDPTTSLTYLALIVISVGSAPWYALVSGAGIGLVPVYVTASNVSYYLQLIFGFFAIQVAMFGTRPLPDGVHRFIDRISGRKFVPAAAATAAGPAASLPAASVAAGNEDGDGAGPVVLHRDSGPYAERLEVRDLRVCFGGLVAVDQLGFTAQVGRITGLIGPNGAGKTTTFNACSGFNRPNEGSVVLNGERNITRLGPAARARLGLGRTFQQMELFDSMTVAENVALGREASLAGANVVSQVVTPSAQRDQIRDRAAEAMAWCGIGGLADTKAADLSTGQRRLVELARALAGPFSLLLLDEPSAGLDRHETEAFGQLLVRAVAERDCGILLVEHDMSLVMDICQYIYVMDFGRLIFEGTPAQIQASELVQAAYLGAEGAAVGSGSDHPGSS